MPPQPMQQPARPQGPNLAQFQEGFDGRSMIGANPRWTSTGGAPASSFPTTQAKIQAQEPMAGAGFPSAPDAPQRKPLAKLIAALFRGGSGGGLY